MTENLAVERLIGSLREVFGRIPDPRGDGSRRLRFDDIAMSAFATFFIQSPEFLDHQREIESIHGVNACRSLFGIDRLPTDNQIRRYLDRISCDNLYEGFDLAVAELKTHQALQPFQVLGAHTLVSLDGREYRNWGKAHHLQRLNKDGSTVFTSRPPSVLTAVLIGPGHSHAVPLRPEFISAEERESEAASRWLARNAERYADLNPLYLGDERLAADQTCKQTLAAGAQFVFRVKASDHKTLFSQLDGVDLPVRTVTETTSGSNKPKREYRYRWTQHRLPLSAGKNPLEVFYVELGIGTVGSGGKRSTFRFITSITPDSGNVAEIIACGRARWKTGNETLNLLRIRGFDDPHNFGPGKDGLPDTLLILNLIAFAFHGACHQVCALWNAAHDRCYRTELFFDRLDLSPRYSYFEDWRALLSMIADPDPRPIA